MKLFQQILNSQKNVKYNDFIVILEACRTFCSAWGFTAQGAKEVTVFTRMKQLQKSSIFRM
ncbi:MAG: hypothetical protein FWG99_00420 [Treponema sp.]|nr:hypothetical protein [Treponema sp.]